MKIFIVEDDLALKRELTIYLTSYGYQCLTSENYQQMVEQVLTATPDLVLLDINLPYLDGYHICREIRKSSDVPIIIVTSRDDDMNELMGINLGADDFISKPYNTQILLARIGAILKRRQHGNDADNLTWGELTLQSAKGVICYQNQQLELTKNEIKILATLMAKQGHIVSRDALMEALWQSDAFVDENTLTVNVNRLRKKLDGIGATDCIKTKRGLGYSL